MLWIASEQRLVFGLKIEPRSAGGDYIDKHSAQAE